MNRVTNPARPTHPARGWLAIALSVIAVSVVVLALATACSGDADHRSGTAASTPNDPERSATTAAATPGGDDGTGSPAAASVLAEGRHPTYLTGLDVSRRTVTFDLIQFLTGAEAAKIWVRTHPDEPEGPPNDYLIVNDNRRLRTLPVADQAQVTVIDTGGASGAISYAQITLEELPAHLAQQTPEAADNRLSYAPYWLTVSNGLVTRIDEQFIP